MAARKTAQAWNGGLVGEPSPPCDVQTTARCTTTGCGAQPGGVRRIPGWDCAAYGSALAELRVGGVR
ncbi:hypothetical protein [Streptomyces bacillaris]|uniref:hypothetical protein n=1 Tax=Streptomyces bacillaris TaxID=68179 RepID=UPI00345F6165